MTDLVDLGAYGADFTADPYRVYEELRAQGPVHRALLPQLSETYETWLVVGYEEGRAALADPRLSKDPMKLGMEVDFTEQSIGQHMLIADPPEHTRLRRLVAREFTGRRVEALRPRIQEITDELLDGLPPSGSADLVEALAFPLPLTVICELLGVPMTDRDAFRRMSNEVVAPTSEQSGAAVGAELGVYLDKLIEDKRLAGPAGDLLSALLRTTEEDGDRLSGDELRAMAFLLLIAGHETTVNLIANGVHALLTHPSQLAELRADMSLLDGAIEEMLRYEGPVENATFRHAMEDLEIGGVAIRKGDPVMISLAAADHDPARFPAPDVFDIHRAPQGHLAFGHGIHFCLGAPLARAEARVAIRTLLERCPDLALDGPPGPRVPGMLIRGLRALPVRW